MYRIRDWLSIGKYTETRSHSLLIRSNIGAMLQLADEAQQPDIPSLYLPIVDGLPVSKSSFDTGLHFIREHKDAGKHILIACGAGISRSVIFTMAALMDYEKLEVFDAYRAVLQHHPDAFPHFELCISLAAYHGQRLEIEDALNRLWETQSRVNSPQNS